MPAKYLIIFIAVVTLVSGCQHKSGNAPYYTDHGDWNSVRLPLIKPFEAIRLNGRKDWFVQAMSPANVLFAAPTAQRMNIIDSMIFIEGASLKPYGSDIKQVWYVLLPNKHVEQGFITHAAYLEYIHELGFKQEPKLYELDKVAEYQSAHDTIDWRNLND